MSHFCLPFPKSPKIHFLLLTKRFKHPSVYLWHLSYKGPLGVQLEPLTRVLHRSVGEAVANWIIHLHLDRQLRKTALFKVPRWEPKGTEAATLSGGNKSLWLCICLLELGSIYILLKQHTFRMFALNFTNYLKRSHLFPFCFYKALHPSSCWGGLSRLPQD